MLCNVYSMFLTGIRSVVDVLCEATYTLQALVICFVFFAQICLWAYLFIYAVQVTFQIQV